MKLPRRACDDSPMATTVAAKASQGLSRNAVTEFSAARSLLVAAGVCVIVLVSGLGVAGSIRTGNAGDGLFKPLLASVPLVGLFLVASRPRHPVGWLFLTAGVAVLAAGVVEDERIAVLGSGPPMAFGRLLTDVSWPLTFPLLGLSLLWFPTGALPSAKWRPVAAAGLAAIGFAVVGATISRWPEAGRESPANPLAVPWLGEHFPLGLVLSLLPLFVLLSVASTLLRYRRADARERHQMRWVAWAAVVSLVSILAAVGVAQFRPLPDWLNGVASVPVVVGLPVCVGIAILRDQLFDIDFLFNRTLLYLALSLGVLGSYVGVVAAVSLAVDATPWIGPATAALVLALVFHPLRLRAQRFADQRLFGDRGQPLRVLGRVSASVLQEPGRYDEVAKSIATSLRLHAVRVELDLAGSGEQRPIEGAFGASRGTPVVEIPIERGATTLGTLSVETRSHREPLSLSEMDLLRVVANQIAAAADAERLADELRQSRSTIVQAREEERRRLRRELHDGLGARLTAIGYGVAAACAVGEFGGRSPRDDGQSAQILAGVQRDLIDATADLRNLIEGLRPAPLEELGLVSALSLSAEHLLGAAGLAFHMSSDIPDGSLSAAVEAAVYRIAIEAVTNVVRHARASNCWLSLSTDPGSTELQVAVRDDGRGMDESALPQSDRQPVGLLSIRERAAELGGRVDVRSVAGEGTVVDVHLPIGRL